jgi:hypothetical protein
VTPFVPGAVLAVRLGPAEPGAPARGPLLAANPATVAVVCGAGKAICFSASRDRGKSFSAPVKVAEAGGGDFATATSSLRSLAGRGGRWARVKT